MRIARNSEGSLIKCQDIENGVVKSNEYYCNNCIYYNNQIRDDNIEENNVRVSQKLARDFSK